MSAHPALAVHTSSAVDSGRHLLRLQPRILAAGAPEVLPEYLVPHLRQAGMRVVHAPDPTALFTALEHRPSLVVLDLDQAAEDGVDLLRRLRARYDGSLILVTARRRHLADCVLGLEMGADDYLVSPVDLRELTARIRNILRRRGKAGRLENRGNDTFLRFGAWELESATRLVRCYGDAPVRLTRGEAALLRAFLQTPQRVLSRADLLRATCAPNDLFDRTIDTRIRRLRRKLQRGRQDLEVIATVHGVGYAFNAEVEPG